MTNIIFFGNGPLAETTKTLIKNHPDFNIIFHAKTKQDLEEAKKIKASDPSAFGILASFGVLIKSDLLDIFEPFGILNIHPSLLPAYRGASPIESAILNGDRDFSVSVMKLVKAMDAGPIYFQDTLTADHFSMQPSKEEIYTKLSTHATNWLLNNINHLPSPVPQDDRKATYTTKFDTSMSNLALQKPAETLLCQIRAFQGFPKSKITIEGHECIILAAHLNNDSPEDQRAKIKLTCGDHQSLIIDRLQPAGRKPMDATSFYNGYLKK